MNANLKLTLQLTLIIHCCAKPSLRKLNSNGIDETERTCECVPFLLCDNGTEVVNGAGLLDVRSKATTVDTDSNEEPPSNVCDNVLELCCESPRTTSRYNSDPPLLQVGARGCGARNYLGVGSKIASDDGVNVAKLGEFPWMVAVLLSGPDQLDVYRCGATLVHRKVVLTAAHCVYGKKASEVKIRAGEWDTQSTDEDLPHQDRAIEEIVIHEHYGPKSLQNDFALLMLSDPVRIADNVDVICLARAKHDFDSKQCIATGWGKDKFGAEGRYQKILKSIELFIVNPLVCQRTLRRTVLGRHFELDRSFICAVSASGEDTCKGDGGSPLICPLKADPKRYVQVGIVSWGIGCGDVPGAYASVLHARRWIDDQLMLHNLDNSIYQYKPHKRKDVYFVSEAD